MKYASTRMEFGHEIAAVVYPLSEVPQWDPANPCPGTYAVPDEVEKGWIRDTQSPTGWAPPCQEWVWDKHQTAVQARLDGFAQERDFTDIATACSYAPSSNPAYRADALHCVDLRDRTWDAFYAAKTNDPNITLHDLLAQLPPLEWSE